MAYIYDPDNKFGYKDELPITCDEKVIRGTDFDAEFLRIQAGVGDSFDETNAGLQQEIEDRIAGDQNLQDQINNLDNSEILGDLNAEIQARIEGDQNLQNQIDSEEQARIEGDQALQNQVDSLENYDDTQITADLAAETQARIDGDAALQGQIDDLLAQPGAGMVISETEPTEEERVPGLQWLDSTTAEVWIWDGNRWLEFPAGPPGPAGSPGADGADGDAYWEQSGDNIYYNDGNVGIGTDDPKQNLEVYGEASAYIDVRRKDVDTGDAAIQLLGGESGVSWAMYQPRNSSDLRFFTNGGGGGDRLTINPAGNVGIGTETIFSKLDISDDGKGAFEFYPNTPSYNGGVLEYINRSDYDLNPDLTVKTGGEFKVRIGATDRLTIDAAGNSNFSGTISAGGNPWSAGSRLFDTGALYVGTTAIDSDLFRGYNGSDVTSSISNNGDATFSGTVTTSQDSSFRVESSSFYGPMNLVHNGIQVDAKPTGNPYPNEWDVSDSILLSSYNTGVILPGGGQQMKVAWIVERNMKVEGDLLAGTVSDSSGPLMSKRGLISTLSTLRNATKDETTLEGLRDSIGNAIGGLIEKFEAEIATMEIPE